MEKLRSFVQKLDSISTWRWLAVVLLVGLVERLGLWLLYQPIAYGDTPSYRRLADAILGGWQIYDGTRTPGYPFFLALVGPDERAWLVQMVLGLATSVLLFYVGWKLTGRAWFGCLVALAHSLNLGQLLFEANLLGETLTTFWLALVLAGVCLWLHSPSRRSVWLAAGIGLASVIALLIRPLFIYLPFWVLLFVAFSYSSRPSMKDWKSFIPRLAVAPALALLLPVALLLGAWIGFIHSRFGDWGMTTMTGYHLIQHTGSFFEYVPDEYASIRDTYIEYRDKQIAEHGNQTNAIWEAIPAMQKASGKSFYDLSRTLARLSVQLIREHPMLYMRNVAKGWWYFWRVPFYWKPETLAWSGLASVLRPLVLVERIGLFGANMLFILTSVLAALSKRARQAWCIPAALWFLAGSVWIASIVQTLLDHGDNPRFLVPMQSFVVLWVLFLIYQYAIHAERRASTRPTL